MLSLRSYRDCVNGGAAIETVLVLPLMLLIGLGAVDGSLLMLQNHKVETGLSSAGNYLAKAPNPKALESKAKNLAVTGHLGSGGKPKVNQWAVSDISINYKATNNNGGEYRGGDIVNVVQLSTSIPFQGLGFLKSVSGGTITVTASYEERLVAERM